MWALPLCCAYTVLGTDAVELGHLPLKKLAFGGVGRSVDPHLTVDEATEDSGFVFHPEEVTEVRIGTKTSQTPARACGLNYYRSIFKVMPLWGICKGLTSSLLFSFSVHLRWW